MRGILIVWALVAPAVAQAAETDLGKIIVSDLAKRRGMVAIEGAGTNGATIGARYAAGTCRKDYERAVARGEPLALSLVAAAPSLDAKLLVVNDEETYQLDQAFASRNKAEISALAKVWNLKASAASALIRQTNIRFTVRRIRFPAFSLPQSEKLTPAEEQILAGNTPPSGTLSVPYELLLVNSFQFRGEKSAGTGLALAAQAADRFKGNLDLGAQKQSQVALGLPNGAVVAFKPIIVWDSAHCRR
jgi:hypothetical protein